MQFPSAPLKHIMAFVTEKIKEKQEEMTYRIYVTEALKALTCATVRYYDLVADDDPKPEKTSEQIKAEIFDVFKKLGGEK